MQSNVISLSDSKVMGALLNPDRFESLMYESLIAANYVSSGFTVQLSDLYGTGWVAYEYVFLGGKTLRMGC